jgi:predicted dehydrogenase
VNAGRTHARRQIGVGVVGFGWLGQAHSRSLARIPMLFADRSYEPRLVACSDAMPARVQDAVSSFGFARGSVDWRAVVEDPDVEAVWIAAPNMVHGEVVAAAAAAGKAVFCE